MRGVGEGVVKTQHGSFRNIKKNSDTKNMKYTSMNQARGWIVCKKILKMCKEKKKLSQDNGSKWKRSYNNQMT
jgi:hypothetical protein